MINCIYCGVEIFAPRRKYCCANHKSYYLAKKNNYASCKKSRARSPRSFMLHLTGYKRLNRRNDLTIDYLDTLYYQQEGLCAITGRMMTHIVGKGKVTTNISIDRIDSDSGYSTDNVQLVCHDVNIMKSTLTMDQLYSLCEEILEHKNK